MEADDLRQCYYHFSEHARRQRCDRCDNRSTQNTSGVLWSFTTKLLTLSGTRLCQQQWTSAGPSAACYQSISHEQVCLLGQQEFREIAIRHYLKFMVMGKGLYWAKTAHRLQFIWGVLISIIVNRQRIPCEQTMFYSTVPSSSKLSIHLQSLMIF